jgi:bifunctional non-homologous end joining protein LigD
MHSMKKEPRAGRGDLVVVAVALFRALLEIDGSAARLVSRNRNRFRHLDPLAAALAKRLRVTDAILDGEIICADKTGRPIFIEMLRGRHPLYLVAFDLLWLDGEDLRPLRLVERKARLRRLLRRRVNHLIAEALAIEGRGKALMAVVEERDLERIVAKRKGDPYRHCKSPLAVGHHSRVCAAGAKLSVVTRFSSEP